MSDHKNRDCVTSEFFAPSLSNFPILDRRSQSLVYTSRRINLHLDGYYIQFVLINLELNRLERKIAALKLSGE